MFTSVEPFAAARLAKPETVVLSPMVSVAFSPSDSAELLPLPVSEPATEVETSGLTTKLPPVVIEPVDLKFAPATVTLPEA